MIEIKGLDKLLKKLDTLPDKVANKVVKEALTESLGVIEAAVKHEAPVDTGKLRDSIHLQPAKTKKGYVYGFVRAGAETAPYANVVEYGTKDIPANPFMTRAFERTKQESLDQCGKQIAEGIEKEMAK